MEPTRSQLQESRKKKRGCNSALGLHEAETVLTMESGACTSKCEKGAFLCRQLMRASLSAGVRITFSAEDQSRSSSSSFFFFFF